MRVIFSNHYKRRAYPRSSEAVAPGLGDDMEIQCPTCQKRLSIGDQFAGQLVKCPACSGVFMAPSLAAPATPAAVPVAASPPDILPFSGDPLPRPEMPYMPPPPRPPAAPLPPLEEEPTGPLSDYTKSSTWHLRPDIVRWIAPVSLTLVFVLSFFNWVHIGLPPASGRNLWEISFGDIGTGGYIFYLLVTFFVALPLAWAKLLVELKVIPLPTFLRSYWSWRTLLVVVVLVMAVVLPFIDIVRYSLVERVDPSGLGMIFGVRFHLLAIVGYALELWLANRKQKRLPLPEATFRI